MIPSIRPLRTKDELDALAVAAKEDFHSLLYPTHIVRNAGEIVGYLSVANTPIVNFWLHSQKVRARESMMVVSLAEAIAAQHSPSIVVPCAENSPFFSIMGSMGYSTLGKTVLHSKIL